MTIEPFDLDLDDVEQVMQTLRVDEMTARFIIAIEKGEIDGDLEAEEPAA